MILFFATLFVAFGSTWQQPSSEILDVLHAPGLPWVWSNPNGSHLLLAQPVKYPPLADRAATMHELAGIRVDPNTNGFHATTGATSPQILSTAEGSSSVDLALPEGLRLIDVDWAVDGRRFAITVLDKDHLGLWVGDVDGSLAEIPNLSLNPLLRSTVSWMPDQQRLVVKAIARGGAVPTPPIIPAGPTIKEGDGDSARSTYESRNLLRTAYDEALFTYYCTSQVAIVDPIAKTFEEVGQPDVYSTVSASPDGKYFLVERLIPPWSHDVAWWRFAHEVQVWTVKGEKTTTIASLPLANEVPIHGVPEGPRSVSWRSTTKAALIWIEALDGGNPVTEATHRDKLMYLKAPFKGKAEEVFRAQHRIRGWSWTPKGGTAVVYQRERERRWRHVWLLDVDKGAKSARAWFDLSEKDRYNDPGYAVSAPMPNGRWVLRQEGDHLFFRGQGGTPGGDRPFLDRRSMKTGETKRLFRSTDDTYERFVAFVGDDSSTFLIRRESPTEVP
ncbi:MAG: S9 family peptidase, partial [Proteobacteria bacterium]|nr:S9 family peptidase [Pseudomonadota bacterium]